MLEEKDPVEYVFKIYQNSKCILAIPLLRHYPKKIMQDRHKYFAKAMCYITEDEKNRKPNYLTTWVLSDF